MAFDFNREWPFFPDDEKLRIFDPRANVAVLIGHTAMEIGGATKVDPPLAAILERLPPVVECSREPAGPCVKLINDGMHRVYSARAARRPITVVYVAGVPAETPYYAFPNPAGWDGVEAIEEISEQYAKKNYRLEPHRSLYRDFNTAFRNATGFRARAVEA